MENMSFGQYIIQLRQDNNMSQRKLAEKAGVTNSTISRIESNLVKPDPLTLEKLSIALSVDKSLLMTKCGYSEIPEDFVVIARKTGEVKKSQREHLFNLLNATIDDFLEKYKEDGEVEWFCNVIGIKLPP